MVYITWKPLKGNNTILTEIAEPWWLKTIDSKKCDNQLDDKPTNKHIVKKRLIYNHICIILVLLFLLIVIKS
jgi:hypothetical protein